MTAEIEKRVQKLLQAMGEFSRFQALDLAKVLTSPEEASDIFNRWRESEWIQLKAQSELVDDRSSGIKLYVAAFPGQKRKAPKPPATEAEAVAEAILLRAKSARPGQPEFRERLLCLHKRCQICGSEVEEVLEAAHIVPHANKGSMEMHNGLLLRADYHTLFDRLLLGIASDFSIQVTKSLQNTVYAQHKKLILPTDPRALDIAKLSAQLTAQFEAFQRFNNLPPSLFA